MVFKLIHFINTPYNRNLFDYLYFQIVSEVTIFNKLSSFIQHLKLFKTLKMNHTYIPTYLVYTTNFLLVDITNRLIYFRTHFFDIFLFILPHNLASTFIY